MPVAEAAWKFSQWTAGHQKDLEAVICTFMSSVGVPPGIAAVVAGRSVPLVQFALEREAVLHVQAGTVTIKDDR